MKKKVSHSMTEKCILLSERKQGRKNNSWVGKGSFLCNSSLGLCGLYNLNLHQAHQPKYLHMLICSTEAPLSVIFL